MKDSVRTRQINIRVEEKLIAALKDGLWELGEFLSMRGKVGNVSISTLTRHALMLTLGLLSKEETAEWLVRLARKYEIEEAVIFLLGGKV